jgi:HSP20 family protein
MCSSGSPPRGSLPAVRRFLADDGAREQGQGPAGTSRGAHSPLAEYDASQELQWSRTSAASSLRGIEAALETPQRHPHIEDQARFAPRFFQLGFLQRRFFMTIVRYDPWAFVGRLQRQFDQALGDSDTASISWLPHVDVREEAERFVVVADLPGVEGKDIEITADKGVLTIRGERRSEKKASNEGFERVERASGTFLRRFTLPESADAEAIKATHANGVLEVSIPKRPQEQPRRISVQAA